MTIKHFTVDAALLAELGERLIGRPHIALAELVKNAYDADATLCQIKISENGIEVVDNGHGMTPETFQNYYLRLGTQNKRAREKSPGLGRRFTGSKGIGRLAAQFLGSEVSLESAAKRKRKPGIQASIDWLKARSGSQLSRFPVRYDEVDRKTLAPFPGNVRYGTRVEISELQKPLDRDDIEQLGRQVWFLRSPFGQPPSTPGRADARDFSIELDAGLIANAQLLFDKVLRDLTKVVWRAKITGRVAAGRKTDRAEIDVEFTANYPVGEPAHTYSDAVSLSGLKWGDPGEEPAKVSDKPLLDELSFTIYVYKLERKQPANVPLEDLKDYLAQFGSVSIYDGGFRLPYYGIDSDWLRNGADQARRLSISGLLPEKWDVEGRYMLDLPAPARLFGAVEISTNREEKVARSRKAKPGEWLLIQSGRDRLVDNLAHKQLQALVRYALDLYANRYRARLLRSREKARDTEPAHRKYSRLRTILRENRGVIPADVYASLEAVAIDAEKAAAASEDLFDARMVVLAPLAAAGMTALGMTHELAREARLIEGARKRLAKLARELDEPELADAAQELAESLVRLRTLQTLFSPLLSEQDREGKDRLLAEPVVRQVAQAMAPLTPGMLVDVRIDPELRFPPAPLAAWNAVLQNALANSWNASLETPEARVAISRFSEGSRTGIRVSDRGVGVDLDDCKRLFDPFERDLEISREHAAMAIGGQGIGLAIVRMLCGKYDVTPSFIEPEDGYATTLELSWKARR